MVTGIITRGWREVCAAILRYLELRKSPLSEA